MPNKTHFALGLAAVFAIELFFKGKGEGLRSFRDCPDSGTRPGAAFLGGCGLQARGLGLRLFACMAPPPAAASLPIRVGDGEGGGIPLR
jgi:hypothetical protein